MNRLNLLIVDDEKFSIEALQNTVPWGELGITRVFSCYNIKDAQELLENEMLNIIICDIEMPSGSGLELLAWIQQENLPVVTILLTCHPDFSYAVTALECKAFAYLLKPFRLTEVCNTIKKAVAKVNENQKMLLLEKRAQKMNVNQTLIEEQFWYQMVTGMYQNSDSSYIRLECTWKNILFPEDTLFKPVLFCMVSDFTELMSSSLLNFTIKNVLDEVFLLSGKCPPPITLSRKYYVILLSEESHLSDAEIQCNCDTVLDFFSKYYQLSLHYFIGDSVAYPLLFEQISSLKTQSDAFFTAASEKQASSCPVIEQSISLIKENPNISREELAAKAFLHPDYFAKLFKKETGTSLSDFIANIKFEEAKYLLAQTPNSISQIASTLGYTNFSYFSKMFRKKTGMTPSEYRKKYYGSI